MDDVRCNNCHRFGHFQASCPDAECRRCHHCGHTFENCPERIPVRNIVVYFADSAVVRASLENTSNRNAEIYRRSFANIQDIRPRTIAGNRFMFDGNAMRIFFNGMSDVLVSLQDIVGDAETLIHVKGDRVNIGARYSIMRGDLLEHTQRSATGRTSMNAASADAYVLLAMEGLFQSIVAVEVNEVRYFLQWHAATEDGHSRQAVVASTLYSYFACQTLALRAPIDSLRDYFLGRQRDSPEPDAISIDSSGDGTIEIKTEPAEQEIDADMDADMDAEGGENGEASAILVTASSDAINDNNSNVSNDDDSDQLVIDESAGSTSGTEGATTDSNTDASAITKE